MTSLSAQSDKIVRIPYSLETAELLQLVQDSFSYTFSYNTSILKPSKTIVFDKEKQYDLQDLLGLLAESYQLNYLVVPGRKILLKSIPVKESYRWIYGYIYEKSSLEPMPEVNISTLSNKLLGVSDADGRYRIRVKSDETSLLYDGISYKPQLINLDPASNRKDVLIEIKDYVIPIIITSSQFDNLLSPKIELNFADIDFSKGLLGDENPLEELFSLSGINSGNEGQTGLYVRGGTPDQNLILYNGVPMYEISHIAGLSSIFVNNNISTIDVYKSAIPARFGGRLSSVIDIQSIRGDKLKYKGEISSSLSSVQASLEGLIIKEQASFNVSVRKSIINSYIDPLLSNFIQFEDLGLAYQDINIGTHFKFDKLGELSIFAYSGRDDILIETISGEGSDFSLTDNTSIRWGTNLVGLNYKNILGDQFYIESGLSWSDYDFESRASYTFEDPNSDSGFLDVLSLSSIEDKSAYLNLDFFLGDRIKFDIGGTINYHDYNPAVQQSRVILDESEVAAIRGDSTISAIESTLYASAKIDINEKLYIEPGLLYSSFTQAETSFSHVQPRISLVSRLTDEFAYVLSAGRTVQYTHLLQNSGTGLPSDLWVPSGENIAPQEADRIALDLKYRYEDRLSFSIGAFYRQTQNAILYAGANDLFYSIINDELEQLIFREPRDWEDQTVSGQSFAQGLEMQFNIDTKRFSFFGGYTLSKVDMQFPSINDGLAFPARHDRRHDLTLNARYFIRDDFSLTANFVYGTGNAFSLTLEEIITIDGETILVNSDRNSFRYPDFHHLDIYFDYRKRLTKGRGFFTFNFGVYNVYARLNPFYVYLFRDPTSGNVRLRQISIFPILPSLRVKYSF